MTTQLHSFHEVVLELAEKYNIPFEIIEAILIDWTKLLYENMASDYNSGLRKLFDD